MKKTFYFCFTSTGNLNRKEEVRDTLGGNCTQVCFLLAKPWYATEKRVSTLHRKAPQSSRTHCGSPQSVQRNTAFRKPAAAGYMLFIMSSKPKPFNLVTVAFFFLWLESSYKWQDPKNNKHAALYLVLQSLCL